MWKTSILLIIIWLGCAWLYYGAILITTTILETGCDPHCGSVNQSLNSGYQNLTSSFYLKITWTPAAEFPGIIITLVIIEIVGRKITMALEFVGYVIFFGLILICVSETLPGLFVPLSLV
ncbi:PREDICTED: putative transporter svop-1 [Amphimedon queenslandica]|uniref:Uncharacterized protein n=2 Tax=Amphimedon queenslandica TaxID=400682 RepID=A0AAN0K4V8_AMPQE|nr:PREDICTED: putative transporter svop-1 [Amphimedon queenslandica]|eukprot:XP_019864224.1 PREDICTED: putative transporter svop-1 [Amphimedon queenslandica]